MRPRQVMPGQTPTAARRRIILAFTITELLVIVVVSALLAAVLLPSFTQGVSLANKLMCQRNLRTLTDAMHIGEGEDISVPAAAAWVSWTMAKASAGAHFCREDTEDANSQSSPSGLEGVYIRQLGHGRVDCSFITDILAGKPVPDPQIMLNPARTPHQSDHCFCWIPERKSNQALVTIDDDGACLITFGDVITTESLDPEGDMHCGSDHWLARGDGNPWQDDEELMQLTGENYQNKIDSRSPVKLLGTGSRRTSYGMNNRVEPRKWRPQQWILVDARKAIIDLRGLGTMDFLDEVAVPRHMGKANVAAADSSVRAVTLMHLVEELDKSDSLWNPR